MGHRPFKDKYRRLGQKLDSLSVKAPWSETLYEILRELYTVDEAELIVKMPFKPSTSERISRLSKIPPSRLEPMLRKLCRKGLVMDLWDGSDYRYMVSPMVIGIFEFTLMRTDPGLDRKKLSRLFSDYLIEEAAFGDSNFGPDKEVSVMRTLPHEESLSGDAPVEILDFERASRIIDENHYFAKGICSCRHEKEHLGRRRCDVPLEFCTSFGTAGKYLVRNGLAQEVSKSEMFDVLSRSRDEGFTMSADNVQQGVGFICFCCSCCCNLLEGIREKGYTRALTTSTLIAGSRELKCDGCGKCAKACPIDAVAMRPAPGRNDNDQVAEVDDTICLGCGVCVLRCETNAMTMSERGRRVLHPSNTFEKLLLQCLERGTLQNLMFDEPDSKGHRFMRAVVGGFLRLPPAKKGLMSEKLRSRFLQMLSARNREVKNVASKF